MNPHKSYRKKKSLQRKVFVLLQSIILITLLLILLLFAVNSITPKPFISLMQNLRFVSGKVNSFQPKSGPSQTMLSDGTLYYQDVKYGTTYPNSYLDVYISDTNKNVTRPTVIVVHGGGYAWGDKSGGDPLAEKSIDSDSPDYLVRLAKAGYNVVSLNYALTPAYLYPTPVLQIDEAIRYLQRNGHKYGLDMNQLVFLGGSAGGQLVGQYVNIQTNLTYAKEMLIQPVLDPKSIKAVVFQSALLDASRFAETGDISVNYLFNLLGKLYFDTRHLKNDASVKQSNVITHVSPDFPPSFISDGNTGTFDEQAKDLNTRLEKIRVPKTFVYFEKNVVELKHGYEQSLDNVYAQKTFSDMIEFLDSHTK